MEESKIANNNEIRRVVDVAGIHDERLRLDPTLIPLQRFPMGGVFGEADLVTPLTPEQIEDNQAIVEKAFGDEKKTSNGIYYKSLLGRYLQVIYNEEGTIFARSCSPRPNNEFVLCT